MREREEGLGTGLAKKMVLTKWRLQVIPAHQESWHGHDNSILLNPYITLHLYAKIFISSIQSRSSSPADQNVPAADWTNRFDRVRLCGLTHWAVSECPVFWGCWFPTQGFPRFLFLSGSRLSAKCRLEKLPAENKHWHIFHCIWRFKHNMRCI